MIRSLSLNGPCRDDAIGSTFVNPLTLAAGEVSAAACITHCAQTSGFSAISAAGACYCLNTAPGSDFYDDEGTGGLCNNKCDDSSSSSCGSAYDAPSDLVSVYTYATVTTTVFTSEDCYE